MSDHSVLTQLALDALDDVDRDVWSAHAGKLVEDYCNWPDWWFDPERHAEINPYQLQIDGIQFHYPPMSQPDYMYWTTDGGELTPLRQPRNENWEFAKQGLEHYLGAIQSDLRDGKTEDAAKRLGILLHFFQDTHEVHALEGPWGTDCFVLDRLLPVPESQTHVTPTMMLMDLGPTQGDVTDHTPQLEGVSVGEAVFRLYSRYVETALANRLQHLPIVQARLGNDEARAHELFTEMNSRIARLTADVIHTVTCLGTGEPPAGEVEATNELHLDGVCPVRRPWLSPSSAYRFSEMVRGCCLDTQRRRHPLRIRLNETAKEFDHGWGGGGHVQGNQTVYDIPADSFEALRGYIGLHDPLGRDGRVDLTVNHDDETVLSQRLDNDAPTAELDLPMQRGGVVTFTVKDGPNVDPTCNNLAWCDLRLIRKT